tara:strand:- start:789 stop:1724 length:936 start_codon:yes stop_codon:yes gene_type:complete
MSKLFPEQPVLFYPSLACRFGVEQAILLSIYAQYALHHGALDAQGNAQFILRRREWLSLASFIDEERLAQLTNSLVDQGVLDAQFQANGSIRVTVLEADVELTTAPAPAASQAPATWSSQPPSGDQGSAKPHQSLSQPSDRLATKLLPGATPDPQLNDSQSFDFKGVVVRGPAPSFGGSTGWARPKDDLQLLFERQELHHQQLKEITPNWQPQPDTLQMLAKKSITDEFSLACADQFVAYYMGQGQRKKSWEQPFMKWVMREWVTAQKKQYREQNNKDQQGGSGERDQAYSRSTTRQRITESLLDIKNTDW